MFKLSKAKSGMLPPQWLFYFWFRFLNERFLASATPVYPKPLGASIPLLALDNLNIFELDALLSIKSEKYLHEYVGV